MFFKTGVGKLWSSGWLPISVNKVLSEHSSFVYILSRELRSCNRDHMACKTKKFYYLALFRKFSNSWFQTVQITPGFLSGSSSSFWLGYLSGCSVHSPREQQKQAHFVLHSQGELIHSPATWVPLAFLSLGPGYQIEFSFPWGPEGFCSWWQLVWSFSVCWFFECYLRPFVSVFPLTLPWCHSFSLFGKNWHRVP